ncbi:MAG: hypothetical protein A2Y57_04185 [Candidatus Woykebacteria bacterium RBG_13_40_7b]|uniref:Uncharacterized protein n=1 Tax=Candidatus Woykebacteria bacterium RBG_13_40_7b TaxID=1802594 RepID=A0A1G1W9F2_9BACT|nr:MAG: hypothetical protein A2Y57_04185 [Candidatus Woykebacteria bacterium RBG_13_40_7b]
MESSLDYRCIDCGRWQGEYSGRKGHKWMLQSRLDRTRGNGPKPSLKQAKINEKCKHEFDVIMGGQNMKTEKHCKRCGKWAEVKNEA